MNTEWNEALMRSVAQTLEVLCFVLPDPDVPLDDWSFEACARLEFRGPMSGTLEVQFRGEALGGITGDMLAQPATPSKKEQADCLAEIANVMCGTLLPMLGDAQTPFDVGSPAVSWQPSSEAEAGKLVARAALGFEDGATEVKLFITEGLDK